MSTKRYRTLCVVKTTSLTYFYISISISQVRRNFYKVPFLLNIRQYCIFTSSIYIYVVKGVVFSFNNIFQKKKNFIFFFHLFNGVLLLLIYFKIWIIIMYALMMFSFQREYYFQTAENSHKKSTAVRSRETNNVLPRSIWCVFIVMDFTENNVNYLPFERQ